MLEIRDLHVKFHTRQREAVAGVSLTIHDGEILGLVGESGSGKSVTAMSVAGLLPRKQCDFSGEILLDGAELLHADRTLLRQVQGREIGVVFQEPQSCMDPLMRIGPQVEEVLRIHTDLSREARRDQALAALAAVELPDPAGVYRKYPHELSGGMLQRAMIAAAVVARPKLLLLDEPTTALDVTIQAQILELLKKLNRESGISMLFISHNLNVVRKLCTRTAVMQRGVLVEEGDIECSAIPGTHTPSGSSPPFPPGTGRRRRHERTGAGALRPARHQRIPGPRALPPRPLSGGPPRRDL